MGWEFFICSTQCIRNVIWSKMLLKCQLQIVFLMCKRHRKYFSYCTELSKTLDNYIEVYVLLFPTEISYFLFIISRYVLWLLWLRKQEQNGRKNLFLLHENILKLEVKLKSYDCWRFPPSVKSYSLAITLFKCWGKKHEKFFIKTFLCYVQIAFQFCSLHCW